MTRNSSRLLLELVVDLLIPSCSSSARTSPARRSRRLRRPTTSRQRPKPRPSQVRPTNKRPTSRLFFTCYVWHLFRLFLTAPTRITSCCEDRGSEGAGARTALFIFTASAGDFKASDESQISVVIYSETQT